MKKTSIGGQAIIEGVMMRGPEKIAIAVRKSNGEIELNVKNSVPITKKNKICSLPIIRGAVALFESLIIGIKALNFSASFFEDEDNQETQSKLDKFIEDKFGDKAENAAIGFSMVISFAFATLLFFILPTYTANFIKKINSNYIFINLMEGIIRIAIFLIYLYLISKLEDIKRVFEYHGAEHKSIYCYESGKELTPENSVQYITLHPRCGTNFLLIVMVVGIIVLSFFGWPNLLLRVISRIITLPLIAGLSYELIKWLGKSDSKAAKIIAYPGMMLQKLTTREPDLKQLEVAIAALKAVIPDDKEGDLW